MAKTRAPTKSRAQKKKKEKPGADMQGRSKHRSAPTAHGSVYVAAPVIGKERELWRKRGDDNAWHSTPPCKGSKKDSRVHRYSRVVGYEQSSEAVREEGANEAIGAARVLFAKVMRGNPDGSSAVVGVPGRGHKYGYIKSLLGAVNATTIESCWAGRCGDLGIGCRNAGRWRSWTHFIDDPIFTTWVFKAITTAGLNSDDSM
ncbi:hypothetical protein M885DRAFT_568449 [Pelagophyceae sp. CCMP2097]|nr:hypothetical protein M885DRAFT_568449 [Pelagophyceae sp. CCMP2097]